jgi:FkbM family methyltransferase
MHLMERSIFPADLENRLKEEFFLGVRDGFFVDVGANDPKNGSQTWHLEELGWRGVVVEPQPRLVQKHKEERHAAVFACVCSSPQNAGKVLQFQVSGIHSSLDLNFFVAGMRKEEIIEVPARTLDGILEDANAPSPIDFLSIDVESHEIEVLSGTTLKRWRPRLILIEDLAFNTRLHRFLRSRGYKWVRRTGLNGWYDAGRFADASKRIRTLAVPAQALSWHAISSHPRNQAQVERVAMDQARSRPACA